MSKQMLKMLRDGVFRPYDRPEMVLIYLAAFLVGFGFSLSELYFVIDFSKAEPLKALPMILIGHGLGCLVMLPAYMSISKILKPPLYYLLMLFSGVLTLLLCVLCTYIGFTSWTIGFVFVPVSAAYWTMFHLSMIANMSSDNSGNEISTSITALVIGVFVGFLLGGALTDLDISGHFVAIGSVALLFSGFIMQLHQFINSEALEKLLKFPQTETVKEALFAHPKRTAMTFLQGAFDMTATTAFPVWMFFMGLSGAFIGIVQAGTVASRLLLSPYVGYLVNKGNNQELVIGCTLKCVGWLPWLLLQKTILIPFSTFLWSIGGHFFNVGISEQWYASRTISGAIGRQYAIGTGRLFGASVSFGLLTVEPPLFLIFPLI